MLVSVISVVVTLAATGRGAPQNGYLYPPAEVDFALTQEESNLEEQFVSSDDNIVFPEESTVITAEDDHHSHADDHDHGHEHGHHDHDHHLGLEWLREAVPGEPGVDYPIFWQAPRTSFNCRLYHEGYYADMETGCQVFHVCNNRGDRTFLCPNGTIFNQEHFTCQWWFSVDCPNARNYYDLNIRIGVVPEETRKTSTVRGTGQRKKSRQPVPEVIPENVQKPKEPREEVGFQEVDPLQTVKQDLFNEIDPVYQDENQPSVYVTEQVLLREDEQEVLVSIAEIPSEYGFIEDGSLQDSTKEKVSVIAQEPEYTPNKILPDFPLAEETPQNTVIQTETNISPEQDETGIILSQDSGSLNFPQEATINEHHSEYPAVHDDSDLNAVQEGTESPFIQQESVDTPNSGKAGNAGLQQDVNSIVEEQDNETVLTIIQQQNVISSNEKIPDFIPPQQEDVFVENSQREDNLVLKEQEGEVSPPLLETSSTFENDFTSSQQETFLPTDQVGYGLVSVQFENVVPEEQKEVYDNAHQDVGSSFLPQDSTIMADEQEGTLIPLEEGGPLVNGQVAYFDDGKEYYKDTQEETVILPTEQPISLLEQHVSFGQEEDSFVSVPNDTPSSGNQVPEVQEVNKLAQKTGLAVTAQPESVFVPVYLGNEQQDIQDSSLISIQPSQQEYNVLVENGQALPVEQGTTFPDFIQQEIGFAPEEGSLTSPEELFTAHQEPEVFDSPQITDDHDTFQHDLLTNPIVEEDQSYNTQDTTGYSNDQQEIGVTSFDQQGIYLSNQGGNQFDTFQQESTAFDIDPINIQIPEEQNVGFELSQQGIDYVPERYGESYSPVPIGVPAIQLQQEFSFVPEHQEDLQASGQYYPINTAEQQAADQVRPQQANEQIVFSQGLVPDNTFPQQDTDLDFFTQQTSDSAQDDQDYIPINPENLQNPSQVVQGFSPDYIQREVPSHEEPIHGDIQEENEVNESHTNEPSDQFLFAPAPNPVKPNLFEVVPEVLPEADSTFESPSAIIPEIPVLYGVPIHSYKPLDEADPSLEILLPSEVNEDITDENDFIVPGVNQVINEGSVIAIPESPIQVLIDESIPEEYYSEELEETLYPVPQEQENPLLNQVPEESLDKTTLEQVDPATEFPGIPNIFQISEEVVPRHSVTTDENIPVITYPDDKQHIENELTTLNPVLPEDITEINSFTEDLKADTNQGTLDHSQIYGDDFVIEKSHAVAHEEESVEIPTEIPFLTIDTNGDTFVQESVVTAHENSLFSELPEEDFTTELPIPVEVATEREAVANEEPSTTLSSLYGVEIGLESFIRSETPKEIKNHNHTANATNVSLESQEESLGEESQEPVTVFPAVINRIQTTAHEDPVVSLVYKETATSLNKNQEEATSAPYVHQEDITVLPKEEEDEDEESATVIPKKEVSFERTVPTTLSPIEDDFVTLSVFDTEEENKIQSSDEEYQDKFTSFPQLVDLDKLFGIPPQEEYEARNEVLPFNVFENNEAHLELQTPFDAEPRLPIDSPPSNQYLPPF